LEVESWGLGGWGRESIDGGGRWGDGKGVIGYGRGRAECKRGKGD